MLKKYCCYCGALLRDKCECDQMRESLIEELEARPETQAGWTFEDNWQNSHFNQR